MAFSSALFECGFCKYIVEPYPLECPTCDTLFCKSCVNSQRAWVCSCGSRSRPQEMHKAVKEILELMLLICPGCKESKKYEKMFNHVTQCQQIKAGDKVKPDQVFQEIVASSGGNVNQQPVPTFSNLGRKIYVVEKDKCILISYDRDTGKIEKSMLKNQNGGRIESLPHNYQFVQVGSPPNLYLVGGGDFGAQQIPKDMYMCRQAVPKKVNGLDQGHEFVARAQMEFPRHGHSATAFGGRYIVVTGSRKDNLQAGNKCEIYDTTADTWSKLSSIRYGRHYHSSCEFGGTFVYIFCGIQNQNKKYFSSIERLNVKQAMSNFNVQWEEVKLKAPGGMNIIQIPPRQGTGSVQSDEQHIMIMGGFGGRYLQDCWDLNVANGTIQSSAKQLDKVCFPFAVPTLSDVSKGEVFTVDWKSMTIFKLKASQWSYTKLT